MGLYHRNGDGPRGPRYADRAQFLARDPDKKERKKAGLRRVCKAPQYTKR